MIKEYFQKRRENAKIIEDHTQKYSTLMLILSAFLATLGLFYATYWVFDPNSISGAIDLTYLISHIILMVTSSLLILFLILNKKKKLSGHALAILINVYVLLLFIYGTTNAILDLKIGASPIIYLLIITAASGLFVVEPIYYTLIVLASFSTMMSFVLVNDYLFFKGIFRYENLINLTLFALVCIISTFKHYEVTIREYKAQKRLEAMSYIDDLTGLFNERGYFEKVDKINNAIKAGEDIEFAIILMDVNNLKVTNDKYGHRYGCHLVVHTGKELPKLFKTSRSYHIGGDEFLTIVLGDDFKNLKNKLEKFEKIFTYSTVRYDGVDLIYSLAHGVSVHQKGELFKDVLQRADEAMYKNKKEIKEKYKMGER